MSHASARQTGFITYILLLLIVFSIPVGLYAVRRQQLIGSKAQEKLTGASGSVIGKSCSACSADVNKDGVVTVDDMAIIKSCINKTTTQASCAKADSNTNGNVDQADVTCVREQLEKKCTVLRPPEEKSDGKKKLIF